MNDNIVQKICEKYNLNTKLENIKPITGGLIHKIWKLKTDRGEYAIKELNADIMSKPTALETFELSEVIASKFLQAGVPAITSLSVEGKHVQLISNVYVIVYNWIEGFTLSNEAVNIEQAYAIGSVIGNIHKSQIEDLSIQNGLPQIFPNSHWQELIPKIQYLLPDYTETLNNISLWNNNGTDIIDALKNNTVVTHGDIDQKNVIWTNDSTPNIIDWEGVSKTNPELEIMDAALNWGGLVSGRVSMEIARAVLESYRSTGCNINEDIRYLLQACIIKWLPWLEFNMRRAISSHKDSEEYSLGISQTENTLRNITLIFDNIDNWTISLS